MRCNPWRWLWGIIPIAMLTWLACTWEREGIETDLRSRAEAALESSGYGWGEVTLDGRDAFLTGVAPDDAQPYRAVETVRQTHGVRIVRARTDAAPAETVAQPPPPSVADVESSPAPEVHAVDPGSPPLDAKERQQWEARWAKARENERRWRSEGLSQPKTQPADDAAENAERQRQAETARDVAAQEAAERQRQAKEETERQRQAAAEAERDVAARKAADAERQRRLAEEAAERQRRAEAEDAKAREAEEAKRRKEEAAARAAEAERQRIADEREQAEAEAEAQRIADEKARAEEAAEKKRQAEAEAVAAERAKEAAAMRKQEEQEVAVARQKEAEDAKRKAEADHCQGLMRSAMAEGVINFARAKSDLTRDSYLTIDRLAGIVKVCPNARVNIAGHTDSEGEIERNQGLSERRAKAVADYLIRRGVDASRLTSEGFGESRPLAPNNTPEGMRQNRRIEFSVTPRP